MKLKWNGMACDVAHPLYFVYYWLQTSNAHKTTFVKTIDSQKHRNSNIKFGEYLSQKVSNIFHRLFLLD